MGAYTDEMANKAYNGVPDSLDDPDSEESFRRFLLSLAGKYHTAGDVLTELLIYISYDPDQRNSCFNTLTENADPDMDSDCNDNLILNMTSKEKASLIRKLFQHAAIPVPRNLNAYLEGTKRFDRRTAYQFAFAFHLNEIETEVLFRKAWLGRVFDLHYEEEAVYWYCIRSGYSYQHAQDMIRRIQVTPKKNIPQEEYDPCPDNFRNDTIEEQRTLSDIIPCSTKILYTNEIRNSIISCDTDEELVRFFNEHTQEYSYNNVTAVRYIRTLWDAVSEMIRKEYDLLSCNPDYNSHPAPCTAEKLLDSIFGWYYIPDQPYGWKAHSNSAIRRNRSLKAVLKQNPLLHPFAEDSFPDRNTLQSCLAGRHVSHESVRKLLILLLFYRFWIKRAIKKSPGVQKIDYRAGREDADRCLQEINRYLNDAGYLELYYGNPYDWIFLFCIPDDEPLDLFRSFMMELVLEKQSPASEA